MLMCGCVGSDQPGVRGHLPSVGASDSSGLRYSSSHSSPPKGVAPHVAGGDEVSSEGVCACV